MSADGIKIVSDNRKARFNYEFLEKFKAGIILTGAEIKSVRLGEINISESYVRPQKGELWLLNAYVRAYSHSGDKEYDPVRPRKLLMHKREIERLIARLEREALTVVPINIHLKNGRAKVEIALARGKDKGDKRATIKKREADREIARAIKER